MNEHDPECIAGLVACSRDAHEGPAFRYYRHTGGWSLSSRLSVRVRRRMFDLFIRELRPTETTRILGLGPNLVAIGGVGQP